MAQNNIIDNFRLVFNPMRRARLEPVRTRSPCKDFATLWGAGTHAQPNLALLIGPGHHWLQTLLVSGYSNFLVLRLMAEFGVVGVVLIWIASLLAVGRERSAHALDPARLSGAHG